MKFRSTNSADSNEVQIVTDELGIFHIFCFNESKPDYRPAFFITAIREEPDGRRGYRLAGPFDSQQMANEARNTGADLIEYPLALEFIARAIAAKTLESVPLTKQPSPEVIGTSGL